MLRSSKKLTWRGSQSSGARSLRSRALGLKRRSDSSSKCSLAGIMKTSTRALHETDREGCRQASTWVVQLQLPDREGVCWGVSSGPEGRRGLRRKRDESLDTVLVLLALLALFVRRRLDGIWRNQDTLSVMLWGFGGKLQSSTCEDLWFCDGPGI